MNELDLLNSKMIPTDMLGSLTIMWTLVEYDYPKCFIVKSNNRHYYALIEIEDKPDKFGWAVNKVSMTDIDMVNKGEKNIQSLFRNTKSKYLLFFENNEEIGKVKEVFDFKDEYEIKGDLFVRNFMGLENHKCLNCYYIRMLEDFSACYCGLTNRLIEFRKNENRFHACPLMYIANEELKAPMLDEDCYCLLKDGSIVFVKAETNQYNRQLQEYEYFSVSKLGKNHISHSPIKHSDIIRIFLSENEARKYLKNELLEMLGKTESEE